ncbi:MAG: hypothetical protein AVDCRST_MAG03-310, partial [uncultured Rubrobacteraceae bacterium]
ERPPADTPVPVPPDAQVGSLPNRLFVFEDYISHLRV